MVYGSAEHIYISRTKYNYNTARVVKMNFKMVLTHKMRESLLRTKRSRSTCDRLTTNVVSVCLK